MKYSKEQLEEAVNGCRSISQLLQKLGRVPRGGNYKTIKYYLKLHEVDISHFKGRGWNSGGSSSNVHSRESFIEKVLIKDGPRWGTAELKRKLIKFGLKKNICSKCGQEAFWHGQELVLQLDHVNGDNTDNRLQNLRIICPNCHTQTATFCNSNIRKKPKRCAVCGKKVSVRGVRCRQCCFKNRGEKQRGIGKSSLRKVERPPLVEVQEFVNQHGYCAAGREYGVSDNAVRKWLKNNIQ